jgi:hypothetical protein
MKRFVISSTCLKWLALFLTWILVTPSLAVVSTYACSPEQQSTLSQLRSVPVSALCSAKPYQLVCKDDGSYGCCKSACECIWQGRLSFNKGWGGGSRNLVSFDLGGACPGPVKSPVITNTPSLMQPRAAASRPSGTPQR